MNKKAFNLGALSQQLEIALRFPDNFSGDTQDQYQDVNLLGRNFEIKIPSLEELKKDIEGLNIIRKTMNLVHIDDYDMFRIGELSTVLSLTLPGIKGSNESEILLSQLYEKLQDIGISDQNSSSLLDDIKDKVEARDILISIEKFISNISIADNDKIDNNVLEEYDIFFSYSTANEDIANDLTNRLRRLNLCVFISHDTIRVGKWKDQVLRGLKSSKIAIILMSEEALQSDWVKYEIGALWALNKVIAPGRAIA